MTNPLLSRRELLMLGSAAVTCGGAVRSGPLSLRDEVPASVRSALERYIPAYLQAMNAPGLTLAVVGATAAAPYTAAFGVADLGTRARVSPAHCFEIGSISKSFAALALLQLQDEGRIDVHDAVLSHLPWLPIEETLGVVTIHHLLTHSSGFAEDSPLFAADGRRRVPGFAPGSRFHYSNWAFDVLGRVIETLDGRPYAQSIEARILRPLGMRDSAAAITNETRARLVPSYRAADDRPYPRHGPLQPAGPLVVTTAAGCLASTSADMAIYMQMLLNGGVGPRGRIVSTRAFESFATAHIRAPDFGPTAGYGYGIAVDTLNGDRILRHTGGMVSFMSSMQLNLDLRHGAFASINAQQGYRPNRVVRYALQLLSEQQSHKPPPPAPPPDEENLPDDSSGYAGTYVSDAAQRLTIVAKDHRPCLQLGHRTVGLQHLEGDAFLADEPGFELFPLVFERDASSPPTADNPPPVIGIGHGRDWYGRNGAPGVTLKNDDLGVYEGVYYSEDPWVGTVRIVARRGRLWLDGLTPLESFGGHQFRFADEPASPETAEFSAIVLGRAQLLSVSGNYLRRISLEY